MTSTDFPNDDKPLPTDAHAESGGLRRVLSLRDFRLLLAGSSTSLLGDQFALIATPWLALELSKDPLALGIVLALEGIPRAAFMLIGGAVTDRFSPRLVMLGTDIARGLLTAAMAMVVLVGLVEMWMLYGFALGFGLIAGFAIPAQNSMVPTLVSEGDLQAGNAIIMGATQLSAFVGPTLAGVVIAAYSTSTTGVGLAFGVDALTFAISATTFALIRPVQVAVAAEPLHLYNSIKEGFQQMWSQEAMRFVFCVLAAVNLFAVGPLLVGIPLIAHQRLPGGAFAFGVLMAAFAIGNLAGYILAGTTPSPSSTTMRRIVISVLAGHGVAIATLGAVTQTAVGAALLSGLGAGNGYLALTLFTWIQARTPDDMLGRIMSQLTFASLGLVSLSQAISGVLSKWNLDGLFLLSGALVLAATAWAATNPGMRAFTDDLIATRQSMNNKYP